MKCSSKVWKRLTKLGKAVWTRVYKGVSDQGTMTHPDAFRVSTVQWATVVHNAACIAAWAAEEAVLELVREGRAKKQGVRHA